MNSGALTRAGISNDDVSNQLEEAASSKDDNMTKKPAKERTQRTIPVGTFKNTFEREEFVSNGLNLDRGFIFEKNAIEELAEAARRRSPPTNHEAAASPCQARRTAARQERRTAARLLPIKRATGAQSSGQPPCEFSAHIAQLVRETAAPIGRPLRNVLHGQRPIFRPPRCPICFATSARGSGHSRPLCASNAHIMRAHMREAAGGCRRPRRRPAAIIKIFFLFYNSEISRSTCNSGNNVLKDPSLCSDTTVGIAVADPDPTSRAQRKNKNCPERIQLAVGPQPLWLRHHNFGLAQRIMVKCLATSRHDPLGITDSACKNQLVVVSAQYCPFNTYIPTRSTTIGKSRVAKDPIAMYTSGQRFIHYYPSDSIGYPRMRASGESSTTKHRLLHASGSHPIPPPNDPKPENSKHSWLKNKLDKDKAKAGSKSFVPNQPRRNSRKAKSGWTKAQPRRDLSGQNMKSKLNGSHNYTQTLKDTYTGKTIKVIQVWVPKGVIRSGPK
ncbi:hypothetical protein F511_29883 [Dorcoceras hygrometricum]|uniref:Uncharacterized protein n=1 Tax=Dorcoceras hygrometricum TaxID=472368 RepID=A0A2Z7BR36_9LAMI|nr:hypothetical protein F511_29883 [Dorcoceras hygrometricum]